MLTPSRELGVFLTHAMYGELEKIAKYRVAGGGSYNSIAKLDSAIDRVLQIAPAPAGRFGAAVGSVFAPNRPSTQRTNELKKIRRYLDDFDIQIDRQKRSGTPQEQANALNAAVESQRVRKRLDLADKGHHSTLSTIEPDPDMAGKAGKKPQKGGLADRVTMGVGKATLGAGGLGLLGAGAYQYSQGAQSQMPY